MPPNRGEWTSRVASVPFVAAWVAAVVWYGFGDTVITLTVVESTPTIREANPVVEAAMAAGPWGVGAVKLVVLVGCFVISISSARAGDTYLPYGVPVLLTLVGIAVTGYNLSLVA
ncbi:MAG: DUF5658 family protein [Halobacteriota archaeon]